MPLLYSLMIVMSLLCACQSSSSKLPQEKQVLRLNIQDEPHSLDPRKARALNDLTMIRMLFEGLTRIGPSEKPEFALARDVLVSQDQKTYTFTLRHSEWSNGDPVVAEDFVYTWKKTLSPSFVSDNASQLYVIKNAKLAKEGKVSVDSIGVRAVDPFTLEVTLENPAPYFMELVSTPIFFPVNHRIDKEHPTWGEKKATFVSNGPFLLSEWKHHNCLELEKNGSYWDAEAVHIPKIQAAMVREETEFKMYEKKELDWAGSPLSILPLDALPHLKKQELLKTKSFLGTHFIRVNTKVVPCDRIMMRKALALAINRQEIVEHVTQGGQVPATGLVPVSMGLQKQPYFRDGDITQARLLFQQIGPEKNALSQMKLTYLAGERAHLIAQIIQQQWVEAFGIRIELEALEKKVYYDRMSKGTFQLAIGSWVADFNDPINFLEVFKFKSGGMNAQWENPEYIKLLESSASLENPSKREELLAKSEQILMEEMPMIPLFHYTMLYVNNEQVKNAVLSPLGSIDFKWAYFDDGKDVGALR